MKRWGLTILFVEPTVDSPATLTDLRRWDAQARDNRIEEGATLAIRGNNPRRAWEQVT